jgi:hypothetical protein
MTRGFNQNPFWDDRSLRSKCGRVTPARHLACKRYNRGLRMSTGAKNQYLSHIETTKRILLGPRTHKRIGRLRPSILAPFAQQPGTPEPPGTPPQPPPDPTAPRPYEEPPRPIPIPRPDEPPGSDDPPPRPN